MQKLKLEYIFLLNGTGLTILRRVPQRWMIQKYHATIFYESNPNLRITFITADTGHFITKLKQNFLVDRRIIFKKRCTHVRCTIKYISNKTTVTLCFWWHLILLLSQFNVSFFNFTIQIIAILFIIYEFLRLILDIETSRIPTCHHRIIERRIIIVIFGLFSVTHK